MKLKNTTTTWTNISWHEILKYEISFEKWLKSKVFSRGITQWSFENRQSKYKTWKLYYDWSKRRVDVSLSHESLYIRGCTFSIK